MPAAESGKSRVSESDLFTRSLTTKNLSRQGCEQRHSRETRSLKEALQANARFPG
jgi:hypothetical protein